MRIFLFLILCRTYIAANGVKYWLTHTLVVFDLVFMEVFPKSILMINICLVRMTRHKIKGKYLISVNCDEHVRHTVNCSSHLSVCPGSNLCEAKHVTLPKL